MRCSWLFAWWLYCPNDSSDKTGFIPQNHTGRNCTTRSESITLIPAVSRKGFSTAGNRSVPLHFCNEIRKEQKTPNCKLFAIHEKKYQSLKKNGITLCSTYS